MSNISVTLATLESYNHIVDDIERGVKIYNKGGIEFTEQEPNLYLAKVPHKNNDIKVVSLTFSRDGQTLEHHHCDCIWRSKGKPICRHVVAAALAIQGGVVETKITLGKTASVTTIVTDDNTAIFMGSGSLPVFATPAMVALMEKAACVCLSDTLEQGQTSVGTKLEVEHTAASAIDAEITATATIESVFGRTINFVVTANDGNREIGKVKHTRAIVDEARFMAKLNKQV